MYRDDDSNRRQEPRPGRAVPPSQDKALLAGLRIGFEATPAGDLRYFLAAARSLSDLMVVGTIAMILVVATVLTASWLFSWMLLVILAPFTLFFVLLFFAVLLYSHQLELTSEQLHVHMGFLGYHFFHYDVAYEGIDAVRAEINNQGGRGQNYNVIVEDAAGRKVAVASSIPSQPVAAGIAREIEDRALGA